MKIMRLLPLAFSIFLLLISGWFMVTGKDAKILINPLVGQNAPLETLQGLAPKNGPYMVSFFASWCPPCRKEHSILMSGADIPIVGIGYKDTPSAIDDYLETKGDPYDVIILDQDGEIAIEWGVTGTPESFIIGDDGRVLSHSSGPLSMEKFGDIRMEFFQ